LTLTVLPERLAVCRLPAGATAARPPARTGFWSLTQTARETSLVVAEALVDPSWRAERGWRALEVDGPLDFALTGILAGIAAPLAAARVPIFAVSTFDTDYVLVRHDDLERAVSALEGAGHVVHRGAVETPRS
jgi:hypothetical protein